MIKYRLHRWGQWACLLTCLAVTSLYAGTGNSADTLMARYTALRSQLTSSVYGVPLVIESGEHDGRVQGEVHAVIEHRFHNVSKALDSPSEWCEILFLHYNAKACVAISGEGLELYLGRKFFQPPEKAHRIETKFEILAHQPDYSSVRAWAEDGPVGIGGFEIRVEAMPLPGDRSFLHFSYSLEQSALSDAAMLAYFFTLGRGKVGFTRDNDGDFVKGQRGMIERNAMRYFLAIQAFLDQPEDRERRRESWIQACERYPRQLHEVEREDYLKQKQREYQEQERLRLESRAEHREILGSRQLAAFGPS